MAAIDIKIEINGNNMHSRFMYVYMNDGRIKRSEEK
jgi:hypothetical protein